MSLLAAIIPIDAPAGRLPWLGRAAQAWFLTQVRRADPALADALHSGQSRRRYTVGVVKSEDRYFLRITSLSAALSDLVIGNILPNIGTGATLAGIEIHFASPQLENNPWAGRSDYEQLARETFAE